MKNYKGNVALEPETINALTTKSETLIFHIRSVSKDSLLRKAGEISEAQLAELKQGLNDILRY
ncbi:MAG: type II toxin-antitoxin system PemK/MazF family toxin [Cyclobacteriaceae bacterium]